MTYKNIPFSDLPPLIGPIKKNNKINFNESEFSDLYEINIEQFDELYLDYDGFYALLQENYFDFGEFIEETQHDQITLLIRYFLEKKEFDKSIMLVKHKYDWLLDIYTSEELYENCVKILEEKDKFLNEIEKINNKHNTKYGK